MNNDEFVRALKQLRAHYYARIVLGKATLREWKIARAKFINESKPTSIAGRQSISERKEKSTKHKDQLELSRKEQSKRVKQRHITSALVVDYSSLTLEEFESIFKRIVEREK